MSKSYLTPVVLGNKEMLVRKLRKLALQNSGTVQPFLSPQISVSPSVLPLLCLVPSHWLRKLGCCKVSFCV